MDNEALDKKGAELAKKSLLAWSAKASENWQAGDFFATEANPADVVLNEYFSVTATELFLLRAFLGSQAVNLVANMLHLGRQTGSPIEWTLLVALVTACSCDDINCVDVVADGETSEFGVRPAPFKTVIHIQYPVSSYRVDFLIEQFKHDPESKDGFGFSRAVIVECDGHEFHEKTKQQAKRDRQRERAIQALGYQILRFTGSEIFNDPFKCAEEVLRF